VGIVHHFSVDPLHEAKLAQVKIEVNQLAERIAEMDRVIQQAACEHC